MNRSEKLLQLKKEISHVIIGKEDVVEMIFIALIGKCPWYWKDTIS
jgi:MoxR-like ATPase